MKKSIVQMLKDNRAELYLDSIMSVFVLCLCIALALAVLPAIIQKQQLEILAKEVTRSVELTGNYSNYESYIETYGNRLGCTGVSGSVKVIDDDDKHHKASLKEIGLQGEFQVTLSKDVDISFGGMVAIPITLESTATGRSEVYYKWSDD